MDNKLYIFLVIMLITLYTLPQVQGAPPFIVSNQNGIIEIRTPGLDVLKAGQSFEFPIHIFNGTSGTPITSGVGCYFHLYDYKAHHLLTLYNSTISHNFDYEFFVNGSNLSVGTYYANYQCNSSNLGGGARYDFQVTSSGLIPSTAQGIVYSLLLLTSLGLMTFFFVFSYTIDGNNEFTMGGDLIRLNANKYFKLGLFFAGYLFTIFSSFLAWQISNQFLLLDLGTAIFKTAFTILWIFAIPLFFFVVILGIMKWLFDLQIDRLAERGLKPR